MSASGEFLLDRYDELAGFGFDRDTALALVSAGYALAPGRFASREGSVNGADWLSSASPKTAHDGAPPISRLGRSALPSLPGGAR